MIETLIAASSAVTTIVTVSCADINTLVDRAKVYPDLSAEDRQEIIDLYYDCLLYTSPSPRDMRRSRMPSSA